MYEVMKKRILTFLAGVIFAMLCFVALNAAMVPVSTSEYCGSKCHEMYRHPNIAAASVTK